MNLNLKEIKIAAEVNRDVSRAQDFSYKHNIDAIKFIYIDPREVAAKTEEVVIEAQDKPAEKERLREPQEGLTAEEHKNNEPKNANAEEVADTEGVVLDSRSEEGAESLWDLVEYEYEVLDEESAHQSAVKNYLSSKIDVIENYLDSRNRATNGKALNLENAPRTIAGVLFEGIGSCIMDLRKEYPRAGDNLEKLLETVNEPGELAFDGAMKAYDFVKDGAIKAVRKLYDAEAASKARSRVEVGEDAIAGFFVDIAPTENQDQVFKVLELFAIGKAARKITGAAMQKRFKEAAERSSDLAEYLLEKGADNRAFEKAEERLNKNSS